MRTALTSSLGLYVLLSAMAVAHAQSPTRQQIEAATDAWRAAFNSREPSRITAMYAPDAAFWGTSMKMLGTTPASVAEYFAGAKSFPDNRVVFNEQHIRIYGDVGLNSGTYTFMLVRDGQPAAVPARFSMAFRRHEDRWLIIDHHSSAMPQ